MGIVLVQNIINVSVRNYPDKNVRPSYLLKKGCTIYKIDREHGALTLKCGREGYYYAKDYDVCIALLRRLKEVGSK